jgi:hypothetical protein
VYVLDRVEHIGKSARVVIRRRVLVDKTGKAYNTFESKILSTSSSIYTYLYARSVAAFKQTTLDCSEAWLWLGVLDPR